MKSFIVAALLFVVALPLRAQITLEHTYRTGGITSLRSFQVDSNDWKYVYFNGKDSILIFGLNHALEHSFVLPSPVPNPGNAYIEAVAKNLFSLRGTYDYLIPFYSQTNVREVRLYADDSSTLFSCDSCQLVGSIFETKGEAKLRVDQYPGANWVKIYSLPGHLPGSSQLLTVGGDPSNPNYTLATPAAYPNPSQGRVRIVYDLPAGVTSGEIVLTTSDGREVKRYHITNAFSDLLIEEGDLPLPAGSYFYKVVTARGESPAQRIVREK